ncbi:SLC35B3 [Bugula neritina]|uniref:Adenosine 3'-phospho 5'-phosphosulfate transporter 2 n=1 Tax=Bugula neritina TaxID=10212 RepID=A0A7J7JBS4_BUGNE|nr:SLC35B3 [Bugula neritina]
MVNPTAAIKVAAITDSVIMTEPEKTEFHCINFSKIGRVEQFFITTILVFIFFVINGFFLELIYRLDGMKDHSWYLTMMQFLCYALFSLLNQVFFAGNVARRGEMRVYLLLAVLTVATMGLSNMAVGYLNYPTQVIFKCCKLIPVLVGGILIQGKKYGWVDFLACACMSIGLIMFTLADSKVQPNFNLYGVAVISGALVADAAIGNVQEKTMKKNEVKNNEMILYSYSLGFVYIFIGLVAAGQFLPAFNFFSQHPVQTYGYGVVFSISGYLGVNAVLYQVKAFGALTAVTVTTFRKMVSIIVSFIIFSKPFTIGYIWGGLVVTLGIYLNLYSNNKDYMYSLLHRILQHRINRQKQVKLEHGDIV